MSFSHLVFACLVFDSTQSAFGCAFGRFLQSQAKLRPFLEQFVKASIWAVWVATGGVVSCFVFVSPVVILEG